MISVTQVNGSGENGPITCHGKYRSNKVGEEITIKDTFTFKVGDYDDGQWTSWTPISKCIGVGGKDCGPGTQDQRRECRREQGGQLCQLDGREVEHRNGSCFLKPCKEKKKVDDTSLDIDCVYELSPCSVTCGGVGRRSVTITTKPRGRGSSCPTEVQCYTLPCSRPVDCNFTWLEWSKCSAECDGGVMSRKANISIQPQYGGEECPGEDEMEERKPCNPKPCPAGNAVVGPWTQWRCNSKCYRPGERLDRGHRETRERICTDFEDNPDPNQKCTNIETNQAREGCSNFAECPPLREDFLKI